MTMPAPFAIYEPPSRRQTKRVTGRMNFHNLELADRPEGIRRVLKERVLWPEEV